MLFWKGGEDHAVLYRNFLSIVRKMQFPSAAKKLLHAWNLGVYCNQVHRANALKRIVRANASHREPAFGESRWMRALNAPSEQFSMNAAMLARLTAWAWLASKAEPVGTVTVKWSAFGRSRFR